MNSTDLLDSRTAIDEVPGWFYHSDQVMFRFFLQRQQDLGQLGEVVELGSYLGKSTVLIGDYVRPGEKFTVIDLFGAEAVDHANASENDTSYSTLTRDAFEANYLRFHQTLPTVHTGLSSTVLDHVQPGTTRYLHVDASHLYAHVASDTDSARIILAPEGIVSFDDYRAEHTPGVAAAVWEAVLTKGLHPIALTPGKFYGTWGDPAKAFRDLLDYLPTVEGSWHEVQEIAGHDVIRCNFRSPSPAAGPAPGRRGNQVRRLRERVTHLEQEVAALRGSASFRVGRAVTAPVRAIRRRRD